MNQIARRRHDPTPSGGGVGDATRERTAYAVTSTLSKLSTSKSPHGHSAGPDPSTQPERSEEKPEPLTPRPVVPDRRPPPLKSVAKASGVGPVALRGSRATGRSTCCNRIQTPESLLGFALFE
jgi:hypothetical protein